MASPLKARSAIHPAMIPAGNPHLEQLRQIVRATEQEPGVYRWFDEAGNVLYVGKAKNLRQRLRSYVTPTPRVEHFRKRALLENMANLEVTYTSSEVEALILEMHLIRSLKPRYNIALTRERHYVFIRIAEHEDFPSVRLVNRREHDAARYLGPYTNPWMQRQMLELLRELYAFRTCSMGIALKTPSLFDEPVITARLPLDLELTRKDRRAPCLDYHIQKCSGPCGGVITKEDYRTRCIDPVIAFYHGDTRGTVDAIIARMKTATGDRKFERAAEMRDLLSYMEEMNYQKKLFDPNAPRMDAIGFDEEHTTAVILQVRGGSLSNEERISLTLDESPSAMLGQIIPQIYAAEDDMPDSIAVPSMPEDTDALMEWLKMKSGKPVRIHTPKKGEMLRLLRLAEVNARRITERAGRLTKQHARV